MFYRQTREEKQYRRSAGWIIAAIGVSLLQPIAARAATANSHAFGASVDVTGQPPIGSTTSVALVPTPAVSGSAPNAYDLTDSVASLAADSALTGPIIQTGTVTVRAASGVPTTDDALAEAVVNEAALDVLQFLSITADSIQSAAQITGPCGGPLTAAGSTTLVNPAVGGTLGAGVPIIEDPVPNTVLLDTQGIRAVLNEQLLSGDGSNGQTLTVNAVHVTLENILVSGVGTLSGEVIISQSHAALACPYPTSTTTTTPTLPAPTATPTLPPPTATPTLPQPTATPTLSGPTTTPTTGPPTNDPSGCLFLRMRPTDFLSGNYTPGTLVGVRLRLVRTCAGTSDVTIRSTLPPGMTFISADQGGSFSDGVVTWRVAATRATQVSFVAGIDLSLTAGTRLATSGVIADALGNARAAEATIVVKRPHNATPHTPVVRVTAPRSATAGRAFTVSIGYKNLDAGGRITVALPLDVALLSASPSPSRVDPDGAASWEADRLPLANGLLRLRVQTSAVGARTFSARITDILGRSNGAMAQTVLQ